MTARPSFIPALLTIFAASLGLFSTWTHASDGPGRHPMARQVEAGFLRDFQQQLRISRGSAPCVDDRVFRGPRRRANPSARLGAGDGRAHLAVSGRKGLDQGEEERRARHGGTEQEVTTESPRRNAKT